MGEDFGADGIGRNSAITENPDVFNDFLLGSGGEE
jgi:hypothetical protein